MRVTWWKWWAKALNPPLSTPLQAHPPHFTCKTRYRSDTNGLEDIVATWWWKFLLNVTCNFIKFMKNVFFLLIQNSVNNLELARVIDWEQLTISGSRKYLFPLHRGYANSVNTFKGNHETHFLTWIIWVQAQTNMSRCPEHVLVSRSPIMNWACNFNPELPINKIRLQMLFKP